jgi:hypothetical protein
MMQDPYSNPAPKKSNSTLLWVIVIAILGICVLGTGIMAAVLFPVFAQARLAAQQTAAMSKVKQLGNAMHLYAQDHDGLLPVASHWMDGIQPYTPQDPAQFSRTSAVSFDFAMSAGLSGVELSEIEMPQATALIFDSATSRRNQAGGAELLPADGSFIKSGRPHVIICFVDGSVKLMDLGTVNPPNVLFEPERKK